LEKFILNKETDKQSKLVFLLLLGTIGLILLVALRWYLLYGTKHFDYMVKHAFIVDRGFSYLFILVNVGLAWIPYFISTWMTRIYLKESSNILLGVLFLVWLCFFPNAPYVLTDILHFEMYKTNFINRYLHWCILFLSILVAFVVGMLSFFQISIILKNWFKRRFYLVLTALILLLSSFGVWLGRFQRWYSWDLVLRPKAFFQGISTIFQDAAQMDNAFVFTVGLTIFMGFCQFLLLKWLSTEKYYF
jgi:uncharacterized membrane protein